MMMMIRFLFVVLFEETICVCFPCLSRLTAVFLFASRGSVEWCSVRGMEAVMLYVVFELQVLFFAQRSRGRWYMCKQRDAYELRCGTDYSVVDGENREQN